MGVGKISRKPLLDGVPHEKMLFVFEKHKTFRRIQKKEVLDRVSHDKLFL